MKSNSRRFVCALLRSMMAVSFGICQRRAAALATARPERKESDAHHNLSVSAFTMMFEAHPTNLKGFFVVVVVSFYSFHRPAYFAWLRFEPASANGPHNSPPCIFFSRLTFASSFLVLDCLCLSFGSGKSFLLVFCVLFSFLRPISSHSFAATFFAPVVTRVEIRFGFFLETSDADSHLDFLCWDHRAIDAMLQASDRSFAVMFLALAFPPFLPICFAVMGNPNA